MAFFYKDSFSVSELQKDYNFNGIDLIKFVCTYMICAIHISPFYPNTDLAKDINFYIQNGFCRVAVPFYFVTSGFLLFRKINSLYTSNFEIIKKYCFKILRLLGTWTFILFGGGTDHLWYLGASALAVILVGFAFKTKLKTTYIILIAIILYIIGLLGDSYYTSLSSLKAYPFTKFIIDSYDSIFKTTRNGIFFGFIFILMGSLFAHKKITINNTVAFLGLFISLGLLFMEVYFIKNFSRSKNYNMLISLVPTVFFMFYIAYHMPLKNHPIFKELRNVSVLIYFTHIYVGYFVDFILSFFAKLGFNFMKWEFIMTILIVTLLSITIEWLSKKDRFYLLKYLYS